MKFFICGDNICEIKKDLQFNNLNLVLEKQERKIAFKRQFMILERVNFEVFEKLVLIEAIWVYCLGEGKRILTNICTLSATKPCSLLIALSN